MDRFNLTVNAIRVHLGGLLDCLYGCSHRHTTFPMTLRAKSSHAETYIVCVECGRQFAYDWTTMHMTRRPAALAVDGRFEVGDRTSAPHHARVVAHGDGKLSVRARSGYIAGSFTH